MIKYYLPILLLLLAIPAFSAIDISATVTTPAVTSAAIDDLNNATVFFHIYPDTVSGATERYILYWPANTLEPQAIHISSSKLYITAFAFLADKGQWSVPISATTHQLVCIQWNFSTPDADDPTVWINGTAQTVTEESTPSGSGDNQGGSLYVGSLDDGTVPFDGQISELAIYEWKIGDHRCEQLTRGKIKGMPLQIQLTFGSSFEASYYWPFDDKADGTTGAQTARQAKATSTTPVTISVTDAIWKAESFLSY